MAFTHAPRLIHLSPLLIVLLAAAAPLSGALAAVPDDSAPVIATPGSGASPTGATWTAVPEPTALHPGEVGRIVLAAKVEPGWHIYSTKVIEGGPSPTQITLGSAPGLKGAGPLQQPAPEKVHDAGFGMVVEEYSKPVAFGLPIRISKAAPPGAATAEVSVEFQACNSRFCLPPRTVPIKVSFAISVGPVRPEYARPISSLPPPPTAEARAPTSVRPAGAGGSASSGSASSGSASSGSASTGSASPGGNDIALRIKKAQDRGLLSFLLLAVVSGFLALATPCVFPMIPITVSLFTKQEEDLSATAVQPGIQGATRRRSSLTNALVYCLGIVGTFTGLGLALAAIFGAGGIAQFATNPWVNIGIAVIFAGLGLSLMGYIDLALPPALVNRATSLSGKGGLPGILLMGFTFTLTSFTCTVPYVGTLLVSTSQGDWLWPALGMLAFSATFAFPFFLLALFPRLLSRLPRSGGWLVTVKAFMGFLELAAAVKFLSNADLVWQAHILTRAVFLGLWAVAGVACGLYLMDIVHLGYRDGKPIGTGRKTLGVIMILLGLYAVAAIFGAPLGDVDAYVPPAGYGFAHEKSELSVGGKWLSSLDEAQGLARATGKPLFVDFTGYTCTNCRWMESHVFTDRAVQDELAHYVLVQLYTDGTTAASAQNQRYELNHFQTVALPLYAVMTASGQTAKLTDGEPAVFPGLTHNPAEFAAFLRQAHSP